MLPEVETLCLAGLGKAFGSLLGGERQETGSENGYGVGWWGKGQKGFAGPGRGLGRGFKGSPGIPQGEAESEQAGLLSPLTEEAEL